MPFVAYALLLALSSGLLGCSGGDGYDISVDVRTDLVPGLDFARVETRVARESVASGVDPLTVVSGELADADFIVGHRVAEVSGFAAGRVYVEVRLVGASGETVLSREAIIELREDYALMLTLSSRCAGVLCPGDGDALGHSACLGGECVDPRCTTEDPTYCGEPQCIEDSECPSVGCRTGVCGDRICLSEPDQMSCNTDQVCAADGVCVAAPVDAGPTDSGLMDSGTPDTGRPDTGIADTGAADTRPDTTGMFCPDEPLLRQQMAVFLVRYMHGVDFVPPAAAGMFSDVDPSSTSAPYIEQLARDRITLGCGGDRFCPGDAVARDQAATFLVRAQYGASYSAPAATGVFSDVSSANVHRNNIEQIYRDGITRGCGASGSGLYCPLDPLLRRHFAVFLVRLVHGRSYTPPPAVGLFSDVPPGTFEASAIEQLAVDRFTRGC